MKYLFLLFLMSIGLINAQTVVETVTDYDGNVYHAIRIGNQIWLQENMKCTHYQDGTSIPDVAVYSNNESNAAIYGRLYTWNAAMKNQTTEKAQGIAPSGYHIPTNTEWAELENYLGGPAEAGGKMKSEGTSLWFTPNTGATNSSGMTIHPGGEYDAYYSPNIFRMLGEGAVFWTSTEISLTKARERYMMYNNAGSLIYDWFKVMKYSIRCIRNSNIVSSDKNNELPDEFRLMQNYPNPFNPSTSIEYTLPKKALVSLKVFDTLGREVFTLINGEKEAGYHKVNINAGYLTSGIYIYKIIAGGYSESRKMLLQK